MRFNSINHACLNRFPIHIHQEAILECMRRIHDSYGIARPARTTRAYQSLYAYHRRRIVVNWFYYTRASSRCQEGSPHPEEMVPSLPSVKKPCKVTNSARIPSNRSQFTIISQLFRRSSLTSGCPSAIMSIIIMKCLRSLFLVILNDISKSGDPSD